MGILIALGLTGLLFGSLILPWTLRTRIARLEHRVQALTLQVRALTPGDLPVQPRVTPPAPPVPPPATAIAMATNTTPAVRVPPPEPAPMPAPTRDTTPRTPSQTSFEWQFGLRLPVWIGGVALALAGFYLVKYSIEIGLLSPVVRVMLGLLFGAGLMGVAHRVHQRARNDSLRITQALCGAGIAVVYASVFAAAQLYHLIAMPTAFVAMAAVTLAAVSLSLAYGAPIAVLGLIGGFLTPALLGTDTGNTPQLFAYLYAVLGGLMVVIRRMGWWRLSALLLLGAYGWVLAWYTLFYTTADAVWVSLFILGVTLTSVWATVTTRRTLDPVQPVWLTRFHYLAIGGAVILLSAIVTRTQYSLLELGLFGLLSTGSLVLAHRDPRHFTFAPFVSLVANVMLVLMWRNPTVAACGLYSGGVALLYAVSGYGLLASGRAKIKGAVLCAAAPLALFMLSYLKLHGWAPSTDGADDRGWTLMAFGLAAIYTALTAHRMRHATRCAMNEHDQQTVWGILAGTATAFLSLGLAIGVAFGYWPVALSLELLGLSWLSTRLPIALLRQAVGVLALALAVLLLPQFWLLTERVISSVLDADGVSTALITQPLLHLGVPALCAALSSVLLRRRADDQLVARLEGFAVGLGAIAGYGVMRILFHLEDGDMAPIVAGFGQRGVITTLCFAAALACVDAGLAYRRRMLNSAGLVLFSIALFRISYFDLLVANPLWDHSPIHGVVLFNTLALAYGAPLAWLHIMRPHARRLGYGFATNALNILSLVLLFVWVSLNVRFAYQGAYLDGTVTSTAEIYTYSVVWLVLGIGLLILGTWRADKALRVASLGIMLLTAGKVFLYDAAELTGLLRVLSFLGLGSVLIALSWFYTRFVFPASANPAQPTDSSHGSAP